MPRSKQTTLSPTRLPPAPRRPGSVNGSRPTRARIVRALLEIVAADGYGAASVRTVVKRAGVSSKTFYAHFQDCEDCFLAAFEECLADLKSVVAPAYRLDGCW